MSTNTTDPRVALHSTGENRLRSTRFHTDLTKSNAPRSDRVSTLWIEGELRHVDHVCLKSMQRAGMDVTLFHYGPISNVPPGIRTADGREILNLSLIERLQPIKRINRSSPVAMFSDFFRIFMLKQDRGMWLDSDVFVLRHFDYDTTKPYFAYEGGGRIGGPVFYVPPQHPIIGEYEELIQQPDLWPNWLGVWRGFVRPTWWRLTGQEFSTQDLGMTIYCNDGLSRLAKRYKCYRDALPKRTFYHWTGRETDKLFQPRKFDFLLKNPEHLGIHIHRKQGALKPTCPGSFWEWALSQ